MDASLRLIQKFADLSIIESFLERLPQLFVQFYAFRFALKNKFEPGFLDIPQWIFLNERVLKEFNAREIISLVSMVFSVLASSFAYSSHLINRNKILARNSPYTNKFKVRKLMRHQLKYSC